MKKGVCIDAKFAEKAKLSGFDYWEAHLSVYTDMSDEEFKEEKKKIDGIGLKAETCCRFFKNGEHRLVGPEADHEKALCWAERSLERAEALGIKTAAVGSGGARRVPEGFSFERAREQFCGLLFRMGEKAKSHGIVLALEPLRREETNFINTVSDGLSVVKATDHANVKLLADYYHICKTGEGLSGVLASKGYLAHVHIADPSARKMPAEKYAHDYAPFRNALSEIGYDKRISVEAGFDDDLFFEQGKEALSILSVF